MSRKIDLGPPKHEVSLAPATKSDHHVRKCARHHNESAAAGSTRRGHPAFASLRSRSARRQLREAWMCCKWQRICRPRLDLAPVLNTYRKNVHTVWGEKEEQIRVYRADSGVTPGAGRYASGRGIRDRGKAAVLSDIHLG